MVGLTRLLSAWLVALALGISHAGAAVVVVYTYSFEFSINPEGQPIVNAVINAGDTVQWQWMEGNHTTTSVAGSSEQWNADLSSGSPTFSRAFNTPGVYHYYCIPHGFDNGDGTAGGMSGTITVLPAGVGACCVGTDCFQLTNADCIAAGGLFQGAGTLCSPNPCLTLPVTVTLGASSDATVYQYTTTPVANGAGRYLHTGNNNSNQIRRGMIRFDTSAIPAGVEVLGVQALLYCNSSSGTPVNVSLARLLSSWTEGPAVGQGGQEASGSTASAGDVTWVHRSFPAPLWAVPGGDFAAESGSLLVTSAGAFFTFSSVGMVADVQHWVDSPGANHGWIIRGDEASISNGKRFSSRQDSTVANRPQLVVTYRPRRSGACCLPNGLCEQLTSAECAAAGGTYRGDGVACESVTCPVVLTPFVDPLPRPAVAVPTTGTAGGAAHYDIAMREVLQTLHRDLPPTRVWGYDGAYPGPTIEARRGQAVTVTWTNDLRELESGQLRATHALTVDTCLHGPDMTGSTPVTIVHLHGGKVAPHSDGYPELAFAPGGSSPVYTYPNAQAAATIWYHDHALGITRLNVMMGLAGFYLIRDDAEEALNIPRGEFEVGLAIQDRIFKADGSFYYPEMWHDHFFGDTVLVNGKVWPYLEVNRGKYRFRLLNGSNSRAYTLALSTGATFWQIGSDTGLLEAPVATTSLTLLPGERADVVMDFAPYSAGTQIILTNSAPAPYPNGNPELAVPHVMKFIVMSEVGDTDPLPATLATVPRTPEAQSVQERSFELAIGPNPGCPGHHDGMWMINGLMWHDITEFPRLGTTEVWAFRNRSATSHPMHMHLVSFQILDRQTFDVVTGVPTGPRVAPAAGEMGWKDTVRVDPGEIVRVIAKFTGWPGRYPYHCHILEHEDHEMMRQFEVVECVGDLNGDQLVDDSDFVVFASSYDVFDCNDAGMPDDCGADLNRDGLVDDADFVMFATAYDAFLCP